MRSVLDSAASPEKRQGSLYGTSSLFVLELGAGLIFTKEGAKVHRRDTHARAQQSQY